MTLLDPDVGAGGDVGSGIGPFAASPEVTRFPLASLLEVIVDNYF